MTRLAAPGSRDRPSADPPTPPALAAYVSPPAGTPPAFPALFLPLRTQAEGAIALCRGGNDSSGKEGDRFLEGNAIALQRLFQLREFCCRRHVSGPLQETL